MTISETGEGLPSRSEFMHGMRHSIPFVLGGVAFGIVFGTVAQDSGLSLLETMLMSALVNGGTAQMIAVGLLVAHAPVVLIVAVSAVVNLRHVFYSAALAG